MVYGSLLGQRGRSDSVGLRLRWWKNELQEKEGGMDKFPWQKRERSDVVYPERGILKTSQNQWSPC